MAQNFILAFGGTGARCAEALVYLHACRSVSDAAHVLLVDPDENNGNVEVARDQLQRYWRIHRTLRAPTAGAREAFFSVPLNGEVGSDSFFWQYPNAHQPFSSLINLSKQSGEHQRLLRLLYDESDMELSFEKGYVGRAHIGSLDLLRTLRRGIRSAVEGGGTGPLATFVRLLREATQRPEGANLIVVGSIFGGTGASGLPAIPPLFRSLFPSGLFDSLRVGCVQMAPYFTFPPGQDHEPDSALHPLATQAALYHYSYTEVGYDRIYLVGAPSRVATNEANHIGGALQRNRAHYAELGAALAGAHFFAEPPNKGAAEVVACGSKEVGWQSLPYHDRTRVKERLVAFATFCLVHSQFLFEDLRDRKHVGARWMRDLTGKDKKRSLSGQEPVLGDLSDFAARFTEWMRELEEEPRVDLFTVGETVDARSLGAVVVGAPDVDAYDGVLRNLNGGQRIAQDTGPGWYIEALSRAAVDFSRDHYSLTTS